jgi:DNA-binding NtrC family response regulator
MAVTHTKPVMIKGERGTGKELTARLIHSRSQLRAAPFVKISGESLTSGLIDSIATAGTLLINDVERTPLDLQEQLMKTQVSMSYDREHPTAKRIMAGSSADLQSEVAKGRLRFDLYCALSVVEIEVPPLRHRSEDLPVLAAEIVHDICRRQSRTELELDDEALGRLSRYNWPGNVRELQLVLECAVMQSRDGVISLAGFLKSDAAAAGDGEPSFVRAVDLKQQERDNILACLKRSRGKVYGSGGAAELLGVKPTTLLYRMKVLKIRKPSL